MSERKRGGLLDAFIATVILLSVVGIVLRMQALRVEEIRDVEMTVEATVSALHAESAACIGVGETLYLRDGTAYGVVEELSTQPASIRLTDGGEVVTGVWSDGKYVDLTLVITLRGVMGEDGFLRDGRYAVLLGEEVELYGERIALRAVIEAVASA